MRGILYSIGTLVTRVESWWAFGGLVMSTGILTWIGQYWGALAQQGLAAVILVSLFASALLLIALSLTYLVVAHLRGTTRVAAPNAPLPLVHGQDFTNQTVAIDGKHFVRCHFSETCIEYRGGPFLITDCQIGNGEITFVMHDHVAMRTIGLMQNFNVFEKGKIQGMHVFSEKSK